MGTLDFWFSMGSTYTYLSAMRIERVAAAASVTVRWRPLKSVMALTGTATKNTEEIITESLRMGKRRELDYVRLSADALSGPIRDRPPDPST